MKDLFRMCGRDDQQGAIAANYMLDVLKAKKIAVIHDKDTYGGGWPMPPARRWRSGAPKKCCTKASPAVKKTLTPGDQDRRPQAGRGLFWRLPP